MPMDCGFSPKSFFTKFKRKGTSGCDGMHLTFRHGPIACVVHQLILNLRGLVIHLYFCYYFSNNKVLL